MYVPDTSDEALLMRFRRGALWAAGMAALVLFTPPGSLGSLALLAHAAVLLFFVFPILVTCLFKAPKDGAYNTPARVAFTTGFCGTTLLGLCLKLILL